MSLIHRQVGVKNELGLRNVEVFVRGKGLTQAIFEPDLFLYKYVNISQT